MSFTGEQPSGNPNVTIYKFKDTASAGGAYVVWSPTRTANVVSNFSLMLPSATKTARSVTLADQKQNGVEAPLTIASGTTTLDVTETPTIILVDGM